MFGKPHEDRIESAGLQPGVAADVVSVDPVFRSLEKCVQNLERLQREAQLHSQKSTYVELARQADFCSFLDQARF